MKFGNKKGIALLYTLISIVLSLMLIIGGLHALNKAFRENPDNQDRLKPIVDEINGLLISDGPDKGTTFFQMGNSEMFMFFSAGGGDIRLEKKGSPSEAIIFKHPFHSVEQCRNRACVCHCNDGPYWKESDTKPYLKPYKISINKEYSCPKPTCMSVGVSSAIFANSRGRYAYSQKVQDIVKIKNDVDEGLFMPIPWDITILMNYSEAAEHDLFFGQRGTNDYHRAEQDLDFVKYLTEEWYWTGGVVIGGTGYARNDDDIDDRYLFGPHVNLKLTKEGEKNIIGVCLELDDCINDQHLNALENQGLLLEDRSKIALGFGVLEDYFLTKTFNCMKNALASEQKKGCIFDLETGGFSTLFKQTTKYYDFKVGIIGEVYYNQAIVQLYISEKGENNYELADSFNMKFPLPWVSEDGKTAQSFDIANDVLNYEIDKGFTLKDQAGYYHIYPFEVIDNEGSSDTFVFAKEEPEIKKI